MNRLLLTFILGFTFLYPSSPEQVEQYLSVSSAEEELLKLEAQFSAMQNGFSQDTNGAKSTYDMQLLTIRFKEYIQKNLSKNEMEEVLKNYKNVVFLQFVSTQTVESPEENETKAYLESLESDPEAEERLDILEDINKALNNKDAMAVMFDSLITPLIKNASGGANISDKAMDAQRKRYLERMSQMARQETLYMTKDFSIEELKELRTVVKTSAMAHEVKVIYAATAYALQEFFLSMASRYDISKHTPKKVEKKNTK